MNIELLRDIEFSKLIEIYRKSKIYIHAMKNEHFGMSIIEAMAAGLVPIVHRSGGPWEDILKGLQGHYGFSYSSKSEAIKYIIELLENEEVRYEIVKRNIKYVINEFSDKMFKKKFEIIIKKILEYKIKTSK
jgi:glycosyltransferase involved in cell wall biosynthesis